MTQNSNSTTGNRITVIDALRGFALLGVILVHFQQRYSNFSMGPFNEHTPFYHSLTVRYSGLQITY